MEILIVLVLIGGAVWFFAWHRPKRAAVNDAAQAWVEDRMLHLLQLDPAAPDHIIATLVRDEIINSRARDPALFAWATPETVARLKRTAIRIAVEQSIAGLPPRSRTASPKPPQKKCSTCGAKNKPARERCRKCFEWLDEERG